MDIDLPSFSAILISFALVIINGIFVAAEFGIVRAHPTKLKSPDLKGKFGITSAIKLTEDLDNSLSSTQLGITLASLLLGWYGERTFQRLFAGMLEFLGGPAQLVVSHAIATALALILITFLHVVIGELAAKTIGIRFPETTLRFLAPPVYLFTAVCRPIISSLAWCSSCFLRLFGIRPETDLERAHSLAEIEMLISHSTERGLLDKEEQQMLEGIFGFSETVAREVMTPRTDLITISAEVGFDELVDKVVNSGHSRFPVVGDSVDEVIGILLARDLLPLLHLARGGAGVKEFDIRRHLREPFFVPGTKAIDDLLNEFKRRSIHMAIVLDEHGGVDGVVTLEDLIEEIVGDIFDESDTAQRDIIVQENGDVIVDGGVLVSDINNRFDLEIPEGDYDTIAGFLMTSLGRMPSPGEQVVVAPDGMDTSPTDEAEPVESSEPGEADTAAPNGDGLPEVKRAVITVEKVTGHRIEKVRLRQLASAAAAAKSASAAQSAASEAKGLAPE
jgi:CBS domain containing-hemolysin-like protein